MTIALACYYKDQCFTACSPSCSVIVSFYTFIYNVDLQLYSITRTFINEQHSKIFRIFHLEYNKRQVSKIASSHDIIDRLKLSSYHIKVLIQNKENHCTNIVSHRILIVLTSSCNIVSRLGQYSYIIPTLLHFHVSGPSRKKIFLHLYKFESIYISLSKTCFLPFIAYILSGITDS